MSESSWLTDRQRDGGVDRVPLPGEVSGGLWLCGKHAIAAGRFADAGQPWDVVVCLCERHELADRYPAYTDWLDHHQEEVVWWPIPDLHAPRADDMRGFVDSLARRVRSGERLLMHCAAGIGRTGTTAVCLLMALGMGRAEAEHTVGDARPMAGPESGAQRALVDELATM